MESSLFQRSMPYPVLSYLYPFSIVSISGTMGITPTLRCSISQVTEQCEYPASLVSCPIRYLPYQKLFESLVLCMFWEVGLKDPGIMMRTAILDTKTRCYKCIAALQLMVSISSRWRIMSVIVGGDILCRKLTNDWKGSKSEFWKTVLCMLKRTKKIVPEPKKYSPMSSNGKY